MRGTRPPRHLRGGLRFSALFASIAALCTLPAVSARPATAPARHLSAAGAAAGHEASEGLRLVAQSGETAGPGSACPRGAPLRAFDVVAINVDITLNRYLDHDSQGRMYVLADRVDAVRKEEARNAAARAHKATPAITLGLQGDAIQPLTLRAHPGDCVRISLRDGLRNEPASIHIHGAALRVAGGGAAIASNAASYSTAGSPVTYEWAISKGQPEGTHYFHSHGNDREQTSHGLFGAIVVEPPGSSWTDPRTGEEARGWDAAITVPGKQTFREFVLYYHEIGNELYLIDAGAGGKLPLVDPILSDYRPSSRALNYRSEPFMHRMRLEQTTLGTVDESMAYSSYAFGDPATPVERSYVGEPTKMRIVHGGSEVSHVHHVHGGAIRWARRPGIDPDRSTTGLTKHPDLLPGLSERTDAQSLGPSETFDTENECGAGGCQSSVGDFLYHCHVAHHYFAGMWGIWRVYNTLQSPGAQTDGLPPLPELAGRRGRVRAAVPSNALAGTVVAHRGGHARITNTAQWAASMLPPPGVARGYDASVWDWTVQSGRVLGEPPDRRSWAGHVPGRSSVRPAVLFDPATGQPAYPFMTPHLGKRPPFPPGHSPSPHLDPPASGSLPSDDPPAPGASGPASLCPSGTTIRQFRIDAMAIPVPLNPREGLVDPDGELYVLAEQRAALIKNPSARYPLVLRANAGQDCVDVVFASSLKDTPSNRGFTKADLHIHFVQFDVQASDGVVTGFNYEQSVRPYATAGTTIRGAAGAGAGSIAVANADAFRPGVTIGIGLDTVSGFEARRVTGVAGTRVSLDRPLSRAHATGEKVSTEFMRYRWYPDAQTGTAYFHDHVNALESWKHGLFGALIVEPPGSTYTDALTGKPLRSGLIADIKTKAKVSADLTGSFREAVILLQDDVPLTSQQSSLGGAIDMRAEPMRLDSGADPFDPRGSPPATPLIQANLGDPVVFRALVAGTNDVHTFHVDGHWFRVEAQDPSSPPASTVRIGISERFDLVVPSAGGPQQRPGDYLYMDGRSSKMREGAWGIFRVLDPARSRLRPLPGVKAASSAPRLCSAAAPVKRYDVRAVEAESALAVPPSNPRVFVLARSKESARSLATKPFPFVLHVAVGDCIEIHMANDTRVPVSMHADLLSYDPSPGRLTPSPAAPDETQTYRFFAAPELGEHAAMLRDLADPKKGVRSGLYGAIVVGPKGSSITSPDGSQSDTGANADVLPRNGTAYRDITLFAIDDAQRIGTHQMPYETDVRDPVSLNGAANPISAGASAAQRVALPAGVTPLVAYAGDPIKIHLLAPASEQTQVFSMEGNEWITTAPQGRVSSTMYGGLDVIDISLVDGASDGSLLPGDYLAGDHREAFHNAGLWTLLRVAPVCLDNPAVKRLTDLPRPKQCSGSGFGGLIGLALFAIVGIFGARNLGRMRRMAKGTTRRR